ncbi:hypothetical protein FB45DRAFT_217145 [Roridomyces roridus]|uniref:DUF6535 domain-containing protein n=1 Tax=Roridomyces roridus TaxID=1738132 RepID=A0AAD7BEG3_9AGAR|nr:hypothetical protein FB45DRAFT_217145 [Roridomyces roridus]
MSQPPPGGSVDTPGDEPCAQIWTVYNGEAEKYDRALAERWRSNMSGILIFAGLFSAILTAFIIESYKTLQPPQQDPYLATLLQISQQLANATGTIPEPQFTISPSNYRLALWCNILWFISLGLSLASALTATLVDNWARDFLQRTEMRPSPVKRARIYAYLYYGLERFKMHEVVVLIPLLLHLSLLFFFGGLIPFLFLTNNTLAHVAIAMLGIMVLLYLSVSVLPLWYYDCPYNTPVSPFLWDLMALWARSFFTLDDKSPFSRSMVETMVKDATDRSAARVSRDKRALAWTMKSLADDEELEPFVEGIPNAIWGPSGRRYKYDELIRGLIDDPLVLLGSRIDHLMSSCEDGLLEPISKTRRQISCLKAIWSLGMMADLQEAHIAQPLTWLNEASSLPSKSEVTALYLPSIEALLEWNNFCSIHAHVEGLRTVTRDQMEAMETKPVLDADITRICRNIDAFLAERRRFKYLIPIRFKGPSDLEHLSRKTPPHADRLDFGRSRLTPPHIDPLEAHRWLREIHDIANLIPTRWNFLRYRILVSYLSKAADLDMPPYQFELTCDALRSGSSNAGIPARNAVKLVTTCVRKAVRIKASSPNHVDTILGILLPWFDTNELGHDLVYDITDRLIEFLNGRDNNEAICRVLEHCDVDRLWVRVSSRLGTCHRDAADGVSKALWHLTSIFPRASADDFRLPARPNFSPGALRLEPIPPYAASVTALLKTHILSAFDVDTATIVSLRLQALVSDIEASPLPNLSAPFKENLRAAETEWRLMTAVCSLLNALPASASSVQPLPPFPEYSVDNYQAYDAWRKATLAAVPLALSFIDQMDESMLQEARFAVGIQFLQACCADPNVMPYPYNAVETFTSNIGLGLFVGLPAHEENQRNFAAVLKSLADSAEERPENARMLQAVIASQLFRPDVDWLTELESLGVVKEVLRGYSAGGLGDGASTESVTVGDILKSLETKEWKLKRGTTVTNFVNNHMGRGPL